MDRVLQRQPSVLIADDHRLLLDTLAALLAPNFLVLRCLTDAGSLLATACELRPDIALIDINMPCLGGVEVASRLRQHLPGCRLIFLTAKSTPSVVGEAFARGAAGFLLKTDTAEEVLCALRTVTEGGRYLSPSIAGGDLARLAEILESSATPLSSRERAVLGLAAAGVPMKEIACRFGITPRTVAFHKYRGMATLGLRRQADLVRFALEHGWLGSPPSSPPL